MANPNLAVPVVHLNGSGERNLINGYSEAISALRDAQKAIAATHPHPRDYYVLKDGAETLQRAEAAHMLRLKKIESVIAEFEELGQAVIEQGR